MTALPLTLERIADLLGGEVSGNHVYAPGPGHSASDRSLSVLIDADAPDGFVVNSFARDDAIACRDYVRGRLELPPFETKKKKANGGGNGARSRLFAEYIYRDANGEPYLLVRKYIDAGGKKQFPQFHWDGTQWLKGKPAGPKIPYNLPQMLAAPTAVIYVCEGEKDADALASACLVATTASEGASAKWAPELTPFFQDRRVVILPDADEPGRKHAQKVAKALYEVAASVKVVDLFPDRSDGHDVTDWLKHDAVGAKLYEAVKAAAEWQPGDDKPIAAATPEDEALLVELAALSLLDYAKRRKHAAKRLGISVSDLDRFVAPLRDEKKFDKQVMLYEHWQVLPWDEAVDGKILFRALSDHIRYYVVLTESQTTAVTLWVVYSWLHEYERFATHSPILLARSAEKDSGKTTLLGVISFLVRRALNSVEISGAALFRSIAKWHPTFVVDEADNVLNDNADLRSVVNSGWTRGQTVIRCHQDTHEPGSFSTFAPKALGMKGDKLPDTTLSRSLAIDMKPKLAGEEIADFDHLDNETSAKLRRQVLRWATDNAEALASRQPEIPQDFHNRRRANWRPLLAIAEQMDVKQAGLQAALEIEQRQIAADPSTGIQLLTAIRFIFDAMEAGRLVLGQAEKDRITTARLAQELIDLGNYQQ
jgi:5S rRNA maturation endonuclease (ribonuclease M5)